jgi:hypothetical protein
MTKLNCGGLEKPNLSANEDDGSHPNPAGHVGGIGGI